MVVWCRFSVLSWASRSGGICITCDLRALEVCYSKAFVARVVGVCRSTQWSCVKCCSRAVLEASSMAFSRRCCGLLLNLPPSSRLFGVDKRRVSTCSCLVSLLLVFV
ncbi:hypothetical protein N665_5333s0002 [Sinapis alba]|nr:hypothetical protein N665_5333s0002 [Sinapis alba]